MSVSNYSVVLSCNRNTPKDVAQIICNVVCIDYVYVVWTERDSMGKLL